MTAFVSDPDSISGRIDLQREQIVGGQCQRQRGQQCLRVPGFQTAAAGNAQQGVPIGRNCQVRQSFAGHGDGTDQTGIRAAIKPDATIGMGGGKCLQLRQVAHPTHFREQVLRSAASSGLNIPDNHFRAVELQQPAIVGGQLKLSLPGRRRCPEVPAGGFIPESPFDAGFRRAFLTVWQSFNQQQPASPPMSPATPRARSCSADNHTVCCCCVC